MARLKWGEDGSRFFETGLDRGVLYIDNDGVPWNGLIGVSENPSGGEPRPFYYDGVKYLNLASAEEFEATIEAFGAPNEFRPCDGSMAINNGLFATQQPRKAFGMSYRTLVGNDTEGQEHGYKIHLVYNALAGPASKDYKTTGSSTDPTTISWDVTTLPPSLTGLKPTAHFVIDSRETPDGLLEAIEDILYGNDANDSRLPLVSELITMFKSQGPVRRVNIIDNPNMLDLNGTVTVRQNMSTNPAYKNVFASAEVRRNLATNPSCETTAGWLSNNPSSWTMSQDSTVKRSGTYSMKSTPAAATIGTSRTLGSIYQAGGGVFPCAANDLITASCYVAHNAGTNAEANIFVQFLDAGGAVLSTLNQNVYVSIGAGNSTFTRIKYSATAAPANTATVRVLVNVQKVTGSNVAANEFCWFDDCLVEKANVMLPYFDGTTAAALGLTYSWTGTAHASAAIASGAQPASASFKGYARNTWVVTGAATDGSNTCRTYIGSSNVANLGVNTLVLFGYDAPVFAAGDTVIGRFRVRLINAAAAITLSPRLYAYTAGGAGIAYVSQGPSVTIPADGSWVDLITPSGLAPATTGSVRLYVTGVLSELQNDAILETSNNMVEKADVAFRWFDGNTAAADGLSYSFTGTANASTSVATGAQPRGWTVAAPDSIYATPNGGAYLFHPKDNSISASHYTDSDVLPGETSTSPATFENPADGYGPKTCYIAMRTYDASGNNLVWSESQRYVINPGESIRISKTVTIVDGEAQLRTYLQANGPGRCKLSEVISNEGTASDYFDGNTPDADGRFYSWASVVNNSRSSMNSWYKN